MADGRTSLASLIFGTSTGGAASSGETTTTLGLDRQDSRVPPDLARVWAAQLNQIKNLLLLITAFWKGGTRLQLLTQTANPFGSSESGLYIDTSGNIYSVFNGARSTIVAPQLLVATFTAVDNVALSWSNLGGTQYVHVGTPIITDGGGGVVFHLTSKTSTGATLNASAPWTGTVAVAIFTL